MTDRAQRRVLAERATADGWFLEGEMVMDQFRSQVICHMGEMDEQIAADAAFIAANNPQQFLAAPLSCAASSPVRLRPRLPLHGAGHPWQRRRARLPAPVAIRSPLLGRRARRSQRRPRDLMSHFVCSHDINVTYPCPTIRALDGEVTS